MIRVYTAENLTDAYLVSNLIRENGIDNHVFNEYANGAVGELPFTHTWLPFTHTWPEVWIENDSDEQRALAIIASRQQITDSLAERECPSCGQLSPANFEICWRCSADLAECPSCGPNSSRNQIHFRTLTWCMNLSIQSARSTGVYLRK